MRGVYYINPDGERFNLWGDLEVTQVSGASPSCNISAQKNAFGDGSDYISERIDAKNILLMIYAGGNYDDARLRLGKIFYGNGEGTLGFIYDDGSERTIKCRFENMNAVITARPGTIQVSLLCCDPFFLADNSLFSIHGENLFWEFDNWELPEDSTFEFSEITETYMSSIDNNGEVDAGCVIRITVNYQATGIKLTKVHAGSIDEYIALRGVFNPGEKVIIDTRPHKQSITLINKNGDSTDIMSRLLWGSTFFSIPRGGCRLKLSADEGQEFLTVSVEVSERFRGV